MLIYMLFVCMPNLGCTEAADPTDSLDRCQFFARLLSGSEKSDSQGRYPDAVNHRGWWYECNSKHVETWETVR